MTHGLANFKMRDLIDKAESAVKLLDSTQDGGGGQEATHEATQEVLRIVLENQIKIAETLDLIKTEFDKFEEGLGKIL